MESVVLNALANQCDFTGKFPEFGHRRPASVWPSATICHCLRRSRSTVAANARRGALPRIQPLHVIAHAFFQRELRLVTQRVARIRQIGLREVLVMRVWIIDVIRLKICAQAFIENIDQFVERARLARAEVINPARLRIERADAPPDRVVHVNKVALPSEVHIPLAPDHPHREVLEQTALNCPVHKSLPAEIHRPTKFFWEG